MEIKDFKIEKVMFKNSGEWNSTCGEFSINLTDILSFLIKRVGRFTKCYASDLFITWAEVESVLKTYPDDDKIEHTFLFGIRENGVDSNAYVCSNYENGDDITYIGGVYMLEIGIKKYRRDTAIKVNFGKAVTK